MSETSDYQNEEIKHGLILDQSHISDLHAYLKLFVQCIQVN